MNQTSVKKLSSVLRVLVLIVFVCNIVVLFFVPGATLLMGETGLDLPTVLAICCRAWVPGFWLWMEGGLYELVLALFLLASGICTAVILWQAKRVLDSILKANTFSFANAANMKRAANGCFVISGVALIRVLIRVVWSEGLAAVLSYNALFVPVFLIAGLVCMVMSALFRQAAELKTENDLTI